MSDLMHRRDTDVDEHMVVLMTTVQVLTQGVKKTVVTQHRAVNGRPPQVPVAFNSANVPTTSAFPTQQPTYEEMVQRHSETRSEQTKQSYTSYNHRQCTRKGHAKSQVPKAIQTDLRFCEVSGPPSFDPYAKGASTTGD